MLTHVCRDWREVFTSRSSLWTDFHCTDADKTRIYLERSKSSPIELWLDREDDLHPHDPLLQVIPHATGRLKSLSVEGAPWNIQDITAHLSRPAPLLEFLSIDGGCGFEPEHNPVLETTLFNGDLSSLHEFHLECVRTELPWRNMVNLTSFMLCHMLPPADVSVERLLDFFGSAPRLRKIELYFATPTPGAQNNRLVSLACLKWMAITGNQPSSLLLDHLLIPVGAKLRTEMGFSGSLIEDHLPRSLDNLRNLSNFTKINLDVGEYRSLMRFTGPNGRVLMVPTTLPGVDLTCPVLESLARFDTSKTERLEILCSNPRSRDLPLQALLPMENLHTFTLSQCKNPYAFIRALHPNSSDVVVCPKLEELVLDVRCDGCEDFDVESVIAMVAARATRGRKLKSVRIADWGILTPIEEWKFGKYTSRVEYGPEVDVVIEGNDGSDEEY